MANREIGNAYISLGIKGFDKLKTQFNTVKGRLGEIKTALKNEPKLTLIDGKKLGEQLKEAGKGIAELGKKASVAFAGLTAAVTGFVAAASPGDFDDFKGVLAEIGVQIGRILVPILREFTGWLTNVRDYLRALSPEQREQIAGWAKYGLVVTGAIAAIAKLGPVLLSLSANPVLALVSAMALFVSLLAKARIEGEALKKKIEEMKKGNINEGDIKDTKLQKILKMNSVEQEEQLEKYQAQLEQRRNELVEKRNSPEMNMMGNEKNRADLSDRIRGLEYRLAQTKGLRKQLDEGGEIKVGKKEDEIKLRPEAPQLGSLISAWQRAQTAVQTETPEMKQRMEQLKVLSGTWKAVEELPDKLAERLRPQMGAAR